MNDNDQLTALAREYAEEMIKGKPSEELPNCLKNSMLAMNTEYVAEIFQWLTRRFCLVEKNSIKALYQDISESYYCDFHNRDTVLKEGSQMKLLESLFPDLGKEVEG